MKIFYSWQSDLPNKTNRGFIMDALEKAAKIVREDDSIEVEPVIDRDTSGVPGSPDIAATIFKKIEEAALFVADVSIINAGSEIRNTPNPNVLIELGYAMKALGQDKIILILNEAFGKVEMLPFDLRTKRTVSYKMNPENEDRATERNSLSGKLVKATMEILSHSATTAPVSTPPLVPLHPAENLDRLFEFRATHKEFHGTEQGNELVKKEFAALCDYLIERAKESNERSKHFIIELRQDNPSNCVVFVRNLQLIASLSKPNFTNSLEGVRLYCGIREQLGHYKDANEISHGFYLPELDIDTGVGWISERAKKTNVPSSYLAKLWFDAFLRELENRI